MIVNKQVAEVRIDTIMLLKLSMARRLLLIMVLPRLQDCYNIMIAWIYSTTGYLRQTITIIMLLTAKRWRNIN
jgi:uncharacterized protein YlxP (DUF503 family)